MSDQARYRSGAVARLVGMPVTTLRVWERRYGLRCTEVAASGHRLYSSADVQRIALIKRLTQRGYAIGSIVTLEEAALQSIEMQDAERPTSRDGSVAEPGQVVRLLVIGLALAQRLQHALPTDTPFRLITVLDQFTQANASSGPLDIDLLLVACPTVQADTAQALLALQAARPHAAHGLVYSYGHAPSCEALQASGWSLLRTPRDDAELLNWLAQMPLQASAITPATTETPANRTAPEVIRSTTKPPARRYDDVTLATLAARPSDVACECPRHVADLVMQLAHFEAYSAECANRNDDDALLHAKLGQLAGSARALLEDALEQVAAAEHIALPSPEQKGP